MRQIKFRGWDKEKKIMFYNVHELYDGYGNITDREGKEIDIYNSSIPVDSFFPWLDGENAVAMQFTGLLDSKGRDIFEGDIIKVGGTTLYTIGWYTQSAAFWIFTIAPSTSSKHIASAGMPMRDWNWLDGGKAIFFHGMTGKSPEVEVIGNIYENPDLLSHPPTQ